MGYSQLPTPTAKKGKLLFYISRSTGCRNKCWRKRKESIINVPSFSSIYFQRASEVLGVTLRQCERILASMKKKELIARVGANKNGHWEVSTRKTSIS